jgi:hypothetical protein
MRVKQKPLQRNLPLMPLGETSAGSSGEGKGILTPRSVIILFFSAVLGVSVAILTYLAAVMPAVAILVAAVFAGGLTFAGAIRLLNTIIR